MNDRETLEVHLNVFGEFKPKLKAAHRESKFVFLGNASPVTQLSVLDQVPDAKLTVADTMDLWINIQRDELQALLKRIDGLVLNDSEAKLLAEDENLVRAGHAVQGDGAEVRRHQEGRARGDVLQRARDVRHARLSDAAGARPDRRRRQLRRRHDGPSRQHSIAMTRRRSRRPWPTA
jgi:hypothetical protein